jgi:phosphoribosylformimino-5-aminoimidazole carboxamide ribotide isomerase
LNPFTIYPAIDLRQGQVVRLAQGDLARATVYSDDPAAMAARWQAAGAVWLHVVNLDGAFGEEGAANRIALEAILKIGLNVQFGGGLRTLPDIETVLTAGVARAVIGTAAVENPGLVAAAITQFGPERIAVGVDARQGRVRVKGWLEATAVRALDLAMRLNSQGARTVIFTDVTRDGLGVGLNLAETTELAQRSGLAVIASGGVAGLADVRRARAAGLAGIIIGRALYEQQIDLAAAIAEARHAG